MHFYKILQKRFVSSTVQKLWIFNGFELVEKCPCNGKCEKFIFRISHPELTEHATQEIEHVFELFGTVPECCKAILLWKST